VTTVCTSCHTLDRVKNKVADKDAWTITVTRMKDKGAGLSDEQLPLVVEYLTRAAGTLTVPRSRWRQRREGRRGQGGAIIGYRCSCRQSQSAHGGERRNYDAEHYFCARLRCIDCHAVNDFSLDTNPRKLKARMMLEMVCDINAKFGDGKTYVTCWTCHRASTQPQVSRPIPQKV
jgi:hypothetical protein